MVVLGCSGRVESTWTASSYREQFPGRAPPGCITVCISGAGCAMAGPDGEHEPCASGDDPVMLDDGSFGTCVATVEACH